MKFGFHHLYEGFFLQQNKRSQANISYHTSLGVLFGVKKYADALWELVKERDININLRSNLVEVLFIKKNRSIFSWQL